MIPFFKQLVCILFLCLSFSMTSQVTLSGKIIDDYTGAPMDGAKVKVKGLNAVAFTDNTGHGTRGFTRSDTANAQVSAFGSTVTIKLFEGQHVRPAVAVNSVVSGGGILVSRHGYFHGILIGT